MEFADIIELVGQGVDAAGVGVILFGAIIAGLFFVRRTLTGDRSDGSYNAFREGLGRALLLGLELLVAADIIRTVAVTPTIESVLVLALIVVIRTFLSWSLEVELTGCWPWQHAKGSFLLLSNV